MSIRIMNWVRDNAAVSGTKLLMLLMLADHANGEGECWPTVERLARQCRISVRQAQYALRALETDNLIERRSGGDGRGRRQRFAILMGATDCTVPADERAKSTAPISAQEGCNPAQERVQSGVHKGCNPAHEKGAIASHAREEPNTEPKFEPTTEPKAGGRVEPRVTIEPPLARPPAIAAYEEVFDQLPNKQQQQAILATVIDVEKWRAILDEWAQRGYRPGNVSDQLDVYRNGFRQNGSANHQPYSQNGAQHSATPVNPSTYPPLPDDFIDARTRARQRLDAQRAAGAA